MNMDNISKINASKTQKTAEKLVASLGYRAAIHYCKSNEWIGIIDEIKKIRDSRRLH
jgi:hypothetical protein